MKNPTLLILILLVAALTFAEGKPQTTCPAMEGQKISKKLYVDADGYRIYACCRACIDAIKADPQKYIEQMKADGIDLQTIPQKTDATSGASRKWTKRIPE